MIKNIELTNYKCFEKIKIKMSEINIITGTNSSGKSSIISSILIYSHSIDNIVNLKKIYEKDFIGYREVTYINANDEVFTIKINNAKKIYREYLEENTVLNNLCKVEGDFSVDLHNSVLYFSSDRILSRLQIQGLNQDTYTPTLNDLYLGDFLYRVSNTLDNSSKKIFFELLNKYMLDLGLINEGIHIEYSLGYYKIFVDNNDIEHVGTGVKHILPLIVTLLTNKDKIICIENPEIHLHPKAQVKLVELILNIATTNNNQIIIETHSDHIINALRVSIKKKNIEPEKVNVIFLDINHKNYNLNLDKNARFDKILSDFFDEYEKQLMELI